MEDVFSFDDFLSKNGAKRVEPIKFVDDEEDLSINDDELVDDIHSGFVKDTKDDELVEDELPTDVQNPYDNIDWNSIDSEKTHELPNSDLEELMLAHDNDDFVTDEEPVLPESEVTLEPEETYESTNESAFVNKDDDDDDFYKLYQDKNEEFACDIMIEGSSPEETYARIIIESENWSLVFPGEIVNGKCIVPIKKLNILKEGEIGNIKLEVVAEGNLFIPWENQFKVKMSKKVTVMMNESKKQKTKKPIIQNKIGVRVNVK